MRRHLSASQIATYQHCGERWRLRYVERRTEPSTTSQIRGSAVHDSVARNMRSKRDARAPLPIDEVRSIAADFVSLSFRALPIAFDEDEVSRGVAQTRGEVLDLAVQMSEVHASEVAPEIEPVSIEETVDITLEGLPTLRAILDLTDSADRVHDTKTTKRTPPKDAADLSLQLSQYHLSFMCKNGRPPSALVLDHLVSTKKGTEPVRQITSRTERQITSYLDRVATVDDAIRKGIAVPADAGSWKCSPKYCGFFGTDCKYTRR